jgi:hypothetical protein
MQRSRVSGIEPAPYVWDFDGAWAPGGSAPRGDTFSIGVFQWVPKKGGGVKRSKVQARFVGNPCNPHLVYQKAREEVERRALTPIRPETLTARVQNA